LSWSVKKSAGALSFGSFGQAKEQAKMKVENLSSFNLY
jgi:hypothetical protein